MSMSSARHDVSVMRFHGDPDMSESEEVWGPLASPSSLSAGLSLSSEDVVI